MMQLVQVACCGCPPDSTPPQTPAARATQLYWLLLALVQDTPPSERFRLRQLEAFKEQVERAALDGNYVSVCD